MKPHKHKEILLKWIQGHDIEYQSPTTDQWKSVPNINELDYEDNYLKPNPLHPDYDWFENWRVKPCN